MSSIDQWISLISFLIVMVLLGLSIYSVIVLFYRNVKHINAIADLIIQNKVLTEQLSEKVSAKNIEESEGFLRFVSQSRDWAFEYIENVQKQLNDFVENVGPVMAYYDKFGRINETPSMNTIFEAYTKLVKILPETNEKQGETK